MMVWYGQSGNTTLSKSNMTERRVSRFCHTYKLTTSPPYEVIPGVICSSYSLLFRVCTAYQNIDDLKTCRHINCVYCAKSGQNKSYKHAHTELQLNGLLIISIQFYQYTFYLLYK